jgi:hypothetical protein
MSMLSSSNKELVYGSHSRLGKGPIFIPKGLALELATIHLALAKSQTWGELATNVPAHAYEEIIKDRNKWESQGIPLPEDAFDVGYISSYSDGDWPAWPQQEMLEWMPEDIQQQYGKIRGTAFNRNFLELDSAKTSEIVNALENRGYVCIEDVSLVLQACNQA